MCSGKKSEQGVAKQTSKILGQLCKQLELIDLVLIIFSLSEFVRHITVILIYLCQLDWFNFPCNFQGHIKQPIAVIWDIREHCRYFTLKSCHLGQWFQRKVQQYMHCQIYIYPFHWKSFKRKEKKMHVNNPNEVSFISMIYT